MARRVFFPLTSRAVAWNRQKQTRPLSCPVTATTPSCHEEQGGARTTQPRVSKGGEVGWDTFGFFSREGGLSDASLIFCAAAVAKEKEAEGEMEGGKEGLFKMSIPILAHPSKSPFSVFMRNSKQLKERVSPLTAFTDTDITGFSCLHNTRKSCSTVQCNLNH